MCGVCVRRGGGFVDATALCALSSPRIHATIAAHTQVLDFLSLPLPSEAAQQPAEQAQQQQQQQLVLPGLDAWGRLLVHGISEFYGLLSAAKPAGWDHGGSCCVAQGAGAGAGSASSSSPAQLGQVLEVVEEEGEEEAQPVLVVYHRQQVGSKECITLVAV